MWESYIVRIFRRNRQEPNQVAGTVERVESEETTSFHSPNDLLDLLHLTRRKPDAPEPEDK
ncbi:MAG: hypothetical protein HY858_10240 [Candidatus Solibacter usitatus]|nr:hypothetical protein [Candidatus Solibacter usitatus]